MDLSDAQACFELIADASHTRHNVGGSSPVGIAADRDHFPAAADIIYSFKVTATAAGDKVEWETQTGVVTADPGDTCTIVGGDGGDFEGVTIPNSATIYGILIRAITVDSPAAPIVVDASPVLSGLLSATGDKLHCIFPAGVAGYTTATITMPASGDSFEVVYIGGTT